MSKIPEDAIQCLDKGFVRLVDSMGGDEAIVQAARVSYGKGTTKLSQDRGLIRYLMRHRHTTPFEMVEFDLMYGKGISKSGELIDLGSKADIVEKSGAWYAYKGEKIGQGRENAKIYLEKNTKIAQEIETAIRTKAGLLSKKIEGNPATKEKETEK